jgi:polygalacturonase
VRDSAAWNTHILNSDNVTIRNVKMLNNRNVLNTDGFDISSSRDVLLEDSFNYCSDDSAVIKSYGENEGRDITVRNNVFLTKKSALKVGTEGEADISDVTFEGNDVIECDRGMTIAMEDGSVYSNIRYIDNRFELVSIDARQRLIDFYIWDRKGGGRIENVLIKDCEADIYWPLPSTIIGYDEESSIKGVTIENFKIAGEVCASLEEANIMIDVMPYWDVRRPHVYDVEIRASEDGQ